MHINNFAFYFRENTQTTITKHVTFSKSLHISSSDVQRVPCSCKDRIHNSVICHTKAAVLPQVVHLCQVVFSAIWHIRRLGHTKRRVSFDTKEMMIHGKVRTNWVLIVREIFLSMCSTELQFSFRFSYIQYTSSEEPSKPKIKRTKINNYTHRRDLIQATWQAVAC